MAKLTPKGTARRNSPPAIFEAVEQADLPATNITAGRKRRAMEGDGLERFAQGSYGAAIQAFTDALPLISLVDRIGRNTLLLNRGLAFLHNDQPAQAICDAEAAMALGGSRERALYIRGMAQRLQGNDAEAAVDLTASMHMLKQEKDRKHVQKVLREVKQDVVHDQARPFSRFLVAGVHMAVLYLIFFADIDRVTSTCLLISATTYLFEFGFDHYRDLPPDANRRHLRGIWSLFFLCRSLGLWTAVRVVTNYWALRLNGQNVMLGDPSDFNPPQEGADAVPGEEMDNGAKSRNAEAASVKTHQDVADSGKEFVVGRSSDGKEVEEVPRAPEREKEQAKAKTKEETGVAQELAALTEDWEKVNAGMERTRAGLQREQAARGDAEGGRSREADAITQSIERGGAQSEEVHPQSAAEAPGVGQADVDSSETTREGEAENREAGSGEAKSREGELCASLRDEGNTAQTAVQAEPKSGRDAGEVMTAAEGEKEGAEEGSRGEAGGVQGEDGAQKQRVADKYNLAQLREEVRARPMVSDDEVADAADRQFEADRLREKGNSVYQQALKLEGVYKRRKLQEALDLYSKAVQADPDSVAALTNRAAVHLVLGKPAAAASDCAAAIATGKRVRAPSRLMARAYERAGKAELAAGRANAALEALVTAQELQPSESTEGLVEEARKAVSEERERQRKEEEERRRRAEEEEERRKVEERKRKEAEEKKKREEEEAIRRKEEEERKRKEDEERRRKEAEQKRLQDEEAKRKQAEQNRRKEEEKTKLAEQAQRKQEEEAITSKKLEDGNGTQRTESSQASEGLIARIAQAETQKQAGNGLFRKGEWAAAAARYAEAVSCLLEDVSAGEGDSSGEMVQACSTVSACYLNGAQCALKLQQWERAEELATAGMGAGGTSAKGMFRRAKANLMLKQHEAALADAKEALRLSPADAEAQRLVDEAQQALEQEGGQKVTSAKQGEENSVESQVFAERGTSEVRRALQSARASKEEGDGKFKAALFDDAVRHYTAALSVLGGVKDKVEEGALGAERAVCMNNRAAALLHLREYSRAIDDCTQVLCVEPANVKALLRRGKALENEGRFREAAADAQSALDLHRGVPIPTATSSPLALDAQQLLARCRKADPSIQVSAKPRTAGEGSGCGAGADQSELSKTGEAESPGGKQKVAGEEKDKVVQSAVKRENAPVAQREENGEEGAEGEEGDTEEESWEHPKRSWEDGKPATKSAVHLASKHKTDGNAHFKKGLWTDALEEYRDAIVMLERQTVDQHDAQVRELLLSCRLNVAATVVRQSRELRDESVVAQRLHDALEACTKVLAGDGENAKALFRRGQVHAEAAALLPDSVKQSPAWQRQSETTSAELRARAEADLEEALRLTGGDRAVAAALEEVQARGAEKRRREMREAEARKRKERAQTQAGTGGGGSKDKGVAPMDFAKWDKVDLDGELERLEEEELKGEGLTEVDIKNKKILDVVQDEGLEEEEKMKRCMALAGHPDWKPKPLTPEEKERKEQEQFLKMMQDPRRQPDEKMAFLSKFYAEKVAGPTAGEGPEPPATA